MEKDSTAVSTRDRDQKRDNKRALVHHIARRERDGERWREMERDGERWRERGRERG
jgi:hypothetical protein